MYLHDTLDIIHRNAIIWTITTIYVAEAKIARSRALWIRMYLRDSEARQKAPRICYYRTKSTIVVSKQHEESFLEEA